MLSPPIDTFGAAGHNNRQIVTIDNLNLSYVIMFTFCSDKWKDKTSDRNHMFPSHSDGLTIRTEFKYAHFRGLLQHTHKARAAVVA